MRCGEDEVPQRNFLFFVFTDLSTKPATSGGVILRFSFLPAALLNRRPPVAPSFVARFLPTALLYRRSPTAPSFVARRKIGEKGVPKGSKAALWILAFNTGVRRGDVLASYEFALVQFTRFRPVRGVWQAHCFHGLDCTAPRRRGFSIAVGSALGVHALRRNRWHFKNNQPDL